MLLEIGPLDFGFILILTVLSFIFVAILVQLANTDRGSTQVSQSVSGDGNTTVNTGHGSTVNFFNTWSQDEPEENHSTGRRQRKKCKVSQNSLRHSLRLKKESRSLVPVVPKHVGRPKRLNTKTLVTCRKYIDNFAQFSAKGKVAECRSKIAKLMKAKTDPDFQVSLRHAASLNVINEGKFKKANHLLSEAKALIPKTRHEVEHRVRWYQEMSLVKLREGKCDVGLVLTNDALPLLDMVAPGCNAAWLLLNHAFFLTEIAAGQDDDEDRQLIALRAEKAYQDAMDQAGNEHPKQMLYSQSRVPQFAKIGLALLYLGCRVSVDNSWLGITDISLDDIRKAKNVITALENEGTVCNSSKWRLMMVKTCLHYRLGSYQEAYDLAQEAKIFATKHSFGGFVSFADNTVQYLQHYV